MRNSLFDHLTRHQLFVEGVKRWLAKDVVRYIRRLAKDVRGVLGRQRLSEMTGRQYGAFMKRIYRIVTRSANSYQKTFMAALRSLVSIERDLVIVIFRQHAIRAIEPIVFSKLWGSIQTVPMGSSGITLLSETAVFHSFVRREIEGVLNIARANVQPIEETETTLFGGDATPTGGTFAKLERGGGAMVALAVAHVATQVQRTLARQAFDLYEWCSIIDSGTSKICLERNGTIYKNGLGPVPPAHPNCRSFTVPTDRMTVPERPTFAAWRAQQPAAFLNSIFDGDDIKPVTFDAFRNSNDFVLATGE